MSDNFLDMFHTVIHVNSIVLFAVLFFYRASEVLILPKEIHRTIKCNFKISKYTREKNILHMKGKKGK